MSRIKMFKFLDIPYLTILMVLSIALISFLTYRDILGYFFTATDSLTLIDTARIQSFGDVVRIFTEPLMNGTKFVEIARYYRPISTLSYSLDYSIWKLNPFGYHLTDLILHILVSVFVFFLILFLTNGKEVIAWVGAIIFTTHPILVESVPAVARRHDIIAALFLLLSLLLFLKCLSRVSVSHKKGFLLLSIFFYALAFGAKEIAIILPFLIFIYLMIYSISNEKSFKARGVDAVKVCLPYFIVTFMLLSWRVYILQGLGGYVNRSFGLFDVIWSLINIPINYLEDLLYPVGFLRCPFNSFPSTIEQIGSLIALFSLFIFLLFYRSAIFRILSDNNAGRLIRLLKILLITVVILSLISILTYPLISSFINQIIQQAYLGEGPRFLTDAMKGRHTLPVEHYFHIAKNLFLKLLFFSLFFSAICLMGIHQRDKIKRFFISSDSGKLLVFLLIWLFLPLSIYLLTLNFSHRNMYISVIPFSAILSVMLVESLQSTTRIIRKYYLSGSSCRSSLIKSAVINFTIFIIIASLSISLLAYSPLVRTYKEWEDSGKISSMFLYRLSEIVTDLPNDAVIHVYNLPDGISSYEAKIPHAKEVAYLADYSIKSWLDLNYPNNHIEVVVHSRSKPLTCPSDLDLEIKTGEDNNVTIIVRFDDN